MNIFNKELYKKDGRLISLIISILSFVVFGLMIHLISIVLKMFNLLVELAKLSA